MTYCIRINGPGAVTNKQNFMHNRYDWISILGRATYIVQNKSLTLNTATVN